MKKSVLVVDDDASMRLALARTIRRAGLDASACASGQEALASLQAREWDVLVTDVRMPGIDGHELLSRALAIRPRLSVIVITAYGTVGDAVQALRQGARDYLLKPFAPEALLDAVHRCWGGSTTKPPGDVVAPPLVGCSDAFTELLERVDRAAAVDANVLILGESGSGKEMIARRLHARSRRARGPFVAINCAALPEGLLEAELFGVKKGAFTGADRDRPGLFERAGGGTVMLDEIADAPMEVQAKLLRAIEQREVVPLGGADPVSVEIRVVSATHKDLAEEVGEGTFRQDLLYRLGVIPLTIPSLRSRREDVLPLAEYFAADAAERHGRSRPGFSAAATDALLRHAWPGNVRELRNVVERAIVLGGAGEIRPEDLCIDTWAQPAERDEGVFRPGMTIAEVERELIERTLLAEEGNRTKASQVLGISVRTLRNKLRAFREADAYEVSSV